MAENVSRQSNFFFIHITSLKLSLHDKTLLTGAFITSVNVDMPIEYNIITKFVLINFNTAQNQARILCFKECSNFPTSTS